MNLRHAPQPMPPRQLALLRAIILRGVRLPLRLPAEPLIGRAQAVAPLLVVTRNAMLREVVLLRAPLPSQSLPGAGDSSQALL